MSTSSTSSLSSEISMENFLTLFVTQLRNQNPLDPTDNTQFMSQLAQFSTLEQEQKQTDSLSKIKSTDSTSLQLDQIALASTFMGKTIKYSDSSDSSTSSSDGSTSSSGNTLSGVVEGVKLEEDGTVSFVIGGKSVSISNFIEVDNTSTTTTSTTESSNMLSKLLGKK